MLSAGCASGEEAYSLAIILRENVPDPSWTISVRAIDVNAVMLEKARRGRYSAWSLRETSPETQRRWFATEGKDFVLDKSVRDAVVFEVRNLVEENPDLWKPESYDVVFCRNVIMYLTPEKARAVIGRIARSMPWTTSLATPGSSLARCRPRGLNFEPSVSMATLFIACVTMDRAST